MAEKSTATEKQGIGDVVDLIKAYARQETVDPLKGAGRWVGLGLAERLRAGLHDPRDRPAGELLRALPLPDPELGPAPSTLG